jgi:hypothetical protein
MQGPDRPLHWRGRKIVIDDVVTAFEPSRRLAISGGWKAADFDLDLDLDLDLLLESAGKGTKVTMDWPLYPKSLLMKVAAPFLGGAMRRATGGAAAPEGVRRELTLRRTVFSKPGHRFHMA